MTAARGGFEGDAMGAAVRPPVELDVDFTDPQVWVEGMPARMRWLRENAPVYWSEHSGLWLLGCFAEVSRVSVDQEAFTSAHGVRPGGAASLGLLEETGPRHAELRAVLSRGFAPQIIQRLEGVFRSRVGRVLDRAVAKSRVEFVHEVATPLAQGLIGEMMGLSEDDQGRLLRFDDRLMASLERDAPPLVDAGVEDGLEEVRRILHAGLEERRRRPQGDMLSVLIGATRPDTLSTLALPALSENTDMGAGGAGPLAIDDGDLVALLATLFVIGTRTTRSALSGAMQLLVENAAERRVLGRNPERIPSAVEEIMRLVSPVQSFGRTVVARIELAGERLAPGDRVLMLYGSANRDPAAFDDPDRFRIDRHPRHLGFGIGPHFCLGAGLARMATRVFVETLVERVGDAIWGPGDEPFRLAPSTQIRDYARMHVDLLPPAPA